jgi:hypothetical protein
MLCPPHDCMTLQRSIKAITGCNVLREASSHQPRELGWRKGGRFGKKVRHTVTVTVNETGCIVGLRRAEGCVRASLCIAVQFLFLRLHVFAGGACRILSCGTVWPASGHHLARTCVFGILRLVDSGLCAFVGHFDRLQLRHVAADRGVGKKATVTKPGAIERGRGKSRRAHLL